MTNWEWLTSDKKRLVKIITDDDFLSKHIDPWWCRGVCPYRIDGECAAEIDEDQYMCGNDAAIIMMWLDAEHND